MSLPDIQVEIAFDSGWSTPAADRTWTDVTQYVELHDGVSIGVGRGDEFATADANTLTLTLDNTDGRFTPGLASSPYYPNVKVGRPIRAYINLDDAPENLLTDNQASVETSVADWRTTGLSFAYSLASFAQSSTRAFHGTDSVLIDWPTTPSASFGSLVGTEIAVSIGETYTFSAHVWVPAGSPPPRVEAIPLPSEGSVFASSGRTSATGAWVRLSCTFTAAVTDYLVGVQVGASTSGQQCFVDAAMLNVGEVAAPFTIEPSSLLHRFVGYVDSWPVSWGGGSDSSAKVQLSATSRLARLGAAKQLRPMILEEFIRGGAALSYPLSEPEEATAASDAIGGGGPAIQVGDGAAVTFGTATGPGTDDLTAATFAGGKTLRAEVDVSSAGDDFWIACWFNTTGSSVDATLVAAAAGATFSSVLTILSTGTLALSGAGPLLNSVSTGFNDGETHLVVAHLQQNGANVDAELWVDGVSEDTGTSVAETLTLDVKEFYIGTQDPAGTFAGTIAYASCGFGDPSALAADWYATGADGVAGETPGDRLVRYASYAGVPAGEIEADTGTPPMAHADTTGQTALDMMRKVEVTEGGVLFDAPDGALTFHSRGRRYIATTQYTVAADSDELEADYSPAYDTQTLLNTVTAKLADESASATAVDSDSVDTYGPRSTELELITTDASEPHAAAWWRVNNYADPVSRVPTLSVSLTTFDADDQVTILGLNVGSRIAVTGLPDQAPAASADYYVEGYTESITPESYVLTFNVSPAEPYLTTWILDSATRSQLDSTTRLAY